MTKRLHVRMPDELHERLTILAEVQDQSLNAVIVALLEESAEQAVSDDRFRRAAETKIETLRRSAKLS